MRRAVEIALLGLAAAAAALFAWGAAGPGAAPSGGVAPARYFHGGKDAAPPPADPACQAGECHAGVAHAKANAESAFRNMHAGWAECLACHGKNAPERWAPGQGGARVLAYAGAASGKERHELLGPALSCRSCHSETGRQTLAGKGVRGLPNNFASPIPLRMLEEKGKRWVTEEMR